MDVAADFVDFVPDRSQLARVGPQQPKAPPAKALQAKAPPVWVAVAVAGALGLSLSMALPPTTHVRDGAITSRAAVENAEADTPARPGEIFRLPAWHEETAGVDGQ